MRAIPLLLVAALLTAAVPAAEADPDCSTVLGVVDCFLYDAFWDECFSPTECLRMYTTAALNAVENACAVVGVSC